MQEILSLSFRPKTLDSMVGLRRTASLIRNHAKKRPPKAWMFIGESGAGKTSIARILAVSLQCTHSKRFGNPCEACYKDQSQFDIIEINASDASTKEELRAVTEGWNNYPKPGSKKRVYILDEAQRMSDASQNLLLKYFEDAPKTTVWMVCTTDPQKLLPAMHRRCVVLSVPPLKEKSIRILVRRAIAFAESDMPGDVLCDALMEESVTSPGRIVMAVEKYLAGETPEKAVQFGSVVDTYSVCRAMIKGDWNQVRMEMADAKPEDAVLVQVSVASYLRAILVGEAGYSDRSAATATCILRLASLGQMPDKLKLSAVSAILYQVCKEYKKYNPEME